ncbi:hypothetical protein KBTX_01850 [wastewater metagenome]|uniref:DUF4332 domain-containing protein n=2 Tax=unclassified sequences TaxID=12908 RepID=A0A5B8RFR2_9ZZZZ|nr:DUF4332 domain-containing protein [Arhodomonas sp. KWT]QEA05527.1 hypothetical protein KBTEX_01850 [uncultured organism]
MWTEWLKRWMEMVFWWLPRIDEAPESKGRERSAQATPTSSRGGSETTAKRQGAEAPATPQAPRASATPAGGQGDGEAASAEGSPKPASAPASAPTSAGAPDTGGADANAATGQSPANPGGSADDLTAIKGIGAAVQKRLAELGIHSFRDLADTDAARLTEQLKARQMVVSQERVNGWVAAARERL